MTASDERLEEHYAYDTVIPACVLFNFDLTDREKILYGLLRNMANSRGYAYPRNARLCKFFGGISEDTVGRMLRHLVAVKAIRIEDGKGGRTLRKIYVGEVYSVNLRTDAGVNLRTDAEVIYKGKKNKKERKKSGDAAVSQEDVVEWLNCWVAKLGLESTESTRLCTALHDLVANRAANGKPVNTIQTAVRLTNKLQRIAGTVKHGTEMMIWLCDRTIVNNWADVFEPVKQSDKADFCRYLESLGIWVYAADEFGEEQEAAGVGGDSEWR